MNGFQTTTTSLISRNSFLSFFERLHCLYYKYIKMVKFFSKTLQIVFPIRMVYHFIECLSVASIQNNHLCLQPNVQAVTWAMKGRHLILKIFFNTFNTRVELINDFFFLLKCAKKILIFRFQFQSFAKNFKIYRICLWAL